MKFSGVHSVRVGGSMMYYHHGYIILEWAYAIAHYFKSKEGMFSFMFIFLSMNYVEP